MLITNLQFTMYCIITLGDGVGCLDILLCTSHLNTAMEATEKTDQIQIINSTFKVTVSKLKKLDLITTF